MNRTKQSGIEDTSQDEGVLVPHENNMYLPGPTTLDYSKGQGFEKMVLPDQPQEENNYDWFFTSGLPAEMADQTASLSMLDTAMSWIKNGTGNFGFVFDKRLKVDESCFEKNRHFEKTRDCGKGVSGEVQAYIDRRSQTPFVRKRLKEGKKMRQEEVEMLIRLAHSNIVDVYALLCDGTRVDLLLQDAGYPLRTCLEKFCKKQIPAEKYWPMLKDLAKQGFEALGYMHQQGFAHLDVKPENWLVHLASDRSLVLVLADFGSSVNLNNTMTFSLELTPEYWAPELWNHVEVFLHKRQLSGGSGGGQEYYKFSPQACFDTYAMGLCVYYMATLKHLLVRLKERQGTDRPLVPPEDLCQACHNYSIDDSTAFKFLLMKQNSDKLPHWAASGPWLFPGIPPTLLTVIRNTLHPDPKKRWTDEQVTRFLSGKAVDDLKTPTQVDNTSLQSGERGQPENTVPDLQKTPGLAVRVDRVVSGCQLEEPEGLMSSGQQRFQETISPYLKVWDRSTKTSQLEQVIPTTISLQESTSQVTQDDTVAGLDPQAGDAAAAKKPSANCAGNKVMRLSTLVMEEQQMCADGGSCAVTEQIIAIDLMNEEVCEASADLEPQTDAMDEIGMEKEKRVRGEREGESLGAQAKGWRGLLENCKVMTVMGSMEDLSMHSKVEPVPMQPPSVLGVKGKGGAKGKGGGKRRPIRPEQKEEVVIDKVKASCSTTKSPQKSVLHGKRPNPFSEPVIKPKIPFVVASSGRPKPKTRMMSGFPTNCTDPQQSSCMSMRDGGTLAQVRPPDSLSASTKGLLECGDGFQPSTQPEGGVFLFGNGGLLTLAGDWAAGSAGPSALGQPSVGGPMQMLVPVPDDQSAISQLPPSASVAVAQGMLSPASHSAAAGHGVETPVQCLTNPYPGHPGAVQESGFVKSVDLKELLHLLEAGEVMEQLSPVPEEPFFPEVGPEENVAYMDKTPIQLDDAGVLPVDDGDLADLIDDAPFDVQGNVPDFAKLFDN